MIHCPHCGKLVCRDHKNSPVAIGLYLCSCGCRFVGYEYRDPDLDWPDHAWVEVILWQEMRIEQAKERLTNDHRERSTDGNA